MRKHSKVFYTSCIVPARRYNEMLMLFEKENIRPYVKMLDNGDMVMGGYMTEKQVWNINNFIQRR